MPPNSFHTLRHRTMQSGIETSRLFIVFKGMCRNIRSYVSLIVLNQTLNLPVYIKSILTIHKFTKMFVDKRRNPQRVHML